VDCADSIFDSKASVVAVAASTPSFKATFSRESRFGQPRPAPIIPLLARIRAGESVDSISKRKDHLAVCKGMAN